MQERGDNYSALCRQEDMDDKATQEKNNGDQFNIQVSSDSGERVWQ